MNFNNKIGFYLGYQVEDKTEFHNKLVEIFGVGGIVKRNRKGEVKDFSVLTDYGNLELDTELKVLQLEIRLADFGDVLTSVEIENLYKMLKDKAIIISDKPWYIKPVATFEM